MAFVSDISLQEEVGLSRMLFVIDEVKYQGDMVLVSGKTSVGTAAGIWKYSEAPAVGRDYHIELQINYPVEADVSYKNKKKAAPSIYVDNDTVIFKGVCEDMDDEVYYLRFDIDWLEMIDIDVFAYGKQIGEYVSFSAKVSDIVIYPYTL